MSNTIVDMAKVTQMLDSGWKVQLYRGGLGSYVCIAFGTDNQIKRLQKFEDAYQQENPGFSGLFIDEDGECVTDDFTPEQALTRLAYKVHGEII